MGLFDSLKKLGEAVEVLNEAANTASKTTIEDFGEPVYSLYTALELGDLHRRIDITDEEGNVKYYTKSSVIALTGKTEILDAAGNNIAHLEKRPVSLHEKHFITMADGRNFTLSNEIFHIVKDVTNIEGLDWQIRGNIIGLNFNLDHRAEFQSCGCRRTTCCHHSQETGLRTRQVLHRSIPA